MGRPCYVHSPTKKTQPRKIVDTKCIQWFTNMCSVKAIILTPKILVFFLPNFASFDIVGKTNFSKNKSMRIKEVTIGS